MPNQPPPPENPAKGEANGSEPTNPLDKFKALTKELLGVSREEVADAEREFQDGRPRRAK